MSELRDTSPEDFNFGALTFELNYAEQTHLDLLDAQAGYLKRLTALAELDPDKAAYHQTRGQLVSIGDDMYYLLRARVDQIVDVSGNDIFPMGPIGGLLSHLDTRQIEYFNERHPAPVRAQPLSTIQTAQRYYEIFSSEDIDLPEAAVRAHAKRTHQHLGYYLMRESISKWNAIDRPPSA